jgi:(p)ppGpp synthase/HD superfamily hydrolase
MYNKSIVALRYWLLAKEYFKALEAMEIAMSWHTGKRKDNVTPEFAHQLSIASYIRSILTSLLYPQESIIAAFFHDLPEDYNFSTQEVEDRFGQQCALPIKLLDKRGKHTDTYYKAIATSPIASIVKAGDRIHNVQSMIGVFDLKKQKEYVVETETYVIPMIKEARRLFPQQEPAYENAKHFLRCQIELIKAIHGNKI